MRLGLAMILAVIGAGCCLALLRFFGRAWRDPTMRALATFFGVSALAYGWLALVNLVQLGGAAPAAAWDAWRPIIFRAAMVSALVYLTWTLYRNGRQ